MLSATKDSFEGCDPLAYHLRGLTETLQFSLRAFRSPCSRAHRQRGTGVASFHQGNMNKDERILFLHFLQRVKQNLTKEV